MLIKKLQKIIKRHPFLYLTRFRLLSKNASPEGIADFNYNILNEKEAIPSCFLEINSKIFQTEQSDNELGIVKQIVNWLYDNTKVGPGLSEPSGKALKTMVYGKGGVCSDMAQIFNNFCVINDIKVREWGTTSAPFNRANGGHSFNEVFISDLEKWLLIDPSWGMLFYDQQGTPLSVIEMYEMSRNGQPVHYQSFIHNKVIEDAQVLKNYLNADVVPFLISDYRNKTYDCHLKVWRPFIPVFIIHFMVYIMGKSYHYQFPLDDYRKIFS